jgi:hypothetical protein
MFISLLPGDTWSRAALAPLEAPDGPRYLAPFACERVDFSGNRGVCLFTANAMLPSFAARVFDEQFQTVATLPLTGLPSRTRVSNDGKLAAITVFERGHSYADAEYSTRTTLVDTVSGHALGDLEQFRVLRDGRPFSRVDFNYWGVTFSDDGNRFFATLSFGGKPYLVEGDVRLREARVLAPDVECPSLSPDGSRLAFKRKVPGGSGGGWRIWLRDLGNGQERPVEGETRTIDDQVEWLDRRTLVYQFPSGEGNNVWAVDVDGSDPARPFVRQAWSPSVVR